MRIKMNEQWVNDDRSMNPLGLRKLNPFLDPDFKFMDYDVVDVVDEDTNEIVYTAELWECQRYIRKHLGEHLILSAYGKPIRPSQIFRR